MRDKTYYENCAELWKDFFLSKGFKLETRSSCDGEQVLRFIGCHPSIVVEVFSGYYREDTETGGCICADFYSTYNKMSQCPVYCDLNENETSVWKAIEILMNAGVEFSNKFGKIIKNRGGWECDPPIYCKKEKVVCNK